MTRIEIDGYEGLLDEEDAGRVSNLHWGLKEKVSTRAGLIYFRHCYWEHGKAKAIYLHRFIMSAPLGTIVDYIDGNTLNNCKSNLRLVSHVVNMQNRKMDKRNKSGFRGVRQQDGKWRATIYVNNRTISLGRFLCKESAAEAYNEAALKYYGPWARLNKIPDKPAEEVKP